MPYRKTKGAATRGNLAANHLRLKRFRLSRAYCGCVDTNAIPDS